MNISDLFSFAASLLVPTGASAGAAPASNEGLIDFLIQSFLRFLFG